MDGNGFRAAQTVTEQEQRTGRLVLQANQVLLWSILAATHAPLTMKGLREPVRDTPDAGRLILPAVVHCLRRKRTRPRANTPPSSENGSSGSVLVCCDV